MEETFRGEVDVVWNFADGNPSVPNGPGEKLGRQVRWRTGSNDEVLRGEPSQWLCSPGKLTLPVVTEAYQSIRHEGVKRPEALLGAGGAPQSSQPPLQVILETYNVYGTVSQPEVWSPGCLTVKNQVTLLF